ncbi:MAG: GTP-binding protein [Chloroflexi bacterium]|nr:GTP-binding protein [Chloroflexota bacterium]
MNATPINSLEGPIAALRESEIRLLTDIAETLGELGETQPEDRQRLRDVAQDLRDLFYMVVIIGEFNCGKSTFVNALLGDDLLPMGITPTTEAIELIRYNETPQRQPILREDGIREWGHPNTGAPGVAIVDTPGAGSVFQRHERVAKAFLHRSDLVIFVISAKRALAETERLYLELAKNFGKKIIVVINQIDLVGPQERDEVRRYVQRQVKELIDIDPLIFMVSAKQALAAQQGQPAGDDSASLDAVRAHLRGVFGEAPPAKQKLLAQLELGAQVVRQYLQVISEKSSLVTADTDKVRDVQRELSQQAQGLDARLVEARADIDHIFEGLRLRGLNFIDTNLSIRRLGRMPSREALQIEFMDEVIGHTLRDLTDASSEYVNALIDSSRVYWRGVIERLNQLRELMEQELSGLDAGVFAEQREALQEAIHIAEAELKTYSSGRVVSEMQDVFRTNLSGFATSAAAALIGLVVAMLATLGTPGPVIGVGAAAFALPALIIGAPVAMVGGYAAYRYYRRVTAETKREFNSRVDQLRQTYHDALDDLTRRERNRLTQYGQSVLTPIFSRLEVLTLRYDKQINRLREHQEQIDTLRKGIVASA